LGAYISLTFDDGLPVQIQHALPELDKRGIPATFFLIVNSPYDTAFRFDVWRAAAKQGHEIGSHTMNHRKAAELTTEEAYAEANDSKNFLSVEIGTPVKSFCYPFTDAPPVVQTPVSKLYSQARGGRVARQDKYLRPGDGANLFNVPCFHVGPKCFDVKEWIDTALARRAWLTLMLHGVGPDDTQWDNIQTENFCFLLDSLLAAKARGLTVLPFGAAAAKYRSDTQCGRMW
jgi:peptidoglycan/xylan/chitin deacetylase (PgdA/CDA1 family)